ncbi:exported hypothetical protein [Agrobacterium tumefaciens str. Kerr 14]|uniref:Uncharacterized protein n=2 Tax=Agrobacterium TaxID=357 RepID=A0A1S7R7N8_9HYPH|nr:hypothetical protein At12D1_22730 [Agrobacterium tumefaciens]CUX17962.1 exported hypothetical protein [Agrobacterium tumefaciens str. Kerr 14]CUX48223.1 exported hypothetical protein [Agrobacterium deltaense Zutra 3/1]
MYSEQRKLLSDVGLFLGLITLLLIHTAGHASAQIIAGYSIGENRPKLGIIA